MPCYLILPSFFPYVTVFELTPVDLQILNNMLFSVANCCGKYSLFSPPTGNFEDEGQHTKGEAKLAISARRVEYRCHQVHKNITFNISSQVSYFQIPISRHTDF